MNRIQLTQNFYLDEFTRSSIAARNGIAIDVRKGSAVFRNILHLCVYLLQPMRDALGPVTIWSGYRPPKVNTLAGGSRTSDHMNGLAADVVVAGLSPLEVAQWVHQSGLPYDQCILEYHQWTHVSITDGLFHPRYESLTAIKKPSRIPLLKAKTLYLPGILPLDEAQRRLS